MSSTADVKKHLVCDCTRNNETPKYKRVAKNTIKNCVRPDGTISATPEVIEQRMFECSVCNLSIPTQVIDGVVRVCDYENGDGFSLQAPLDKCVFGIHTDTYEFAHGRDDAYMATLKLQCHSVGHENYNIIAPDDVREDNLRYFEEYLAAHNLLLDNTMENIWAIYPNETHAARNIRELRQSIHDVLTATGAKVHMFCGDGFEVAADEAEYETWYSPEDKYQEFLDSEPNTIEAVFKRIGMI